MKNYLIIICEIVLLIGCSSNNSGFLCNNEKAFISVKDFYCMAFDPDEPKITPCNPFLFDTLISTSQLDSFSSYLCNNGLVDCSGCISLKYLYKRDTIYIPALPISCKGCMVSFYPPKSFHVLLKNDSIILKDYNSEEYLHFNAYKDSLDKIFSESIGDFCRFMTKRKPYYDNLDSLNSWRYLNNSFRRVLVIEISDDTQIKNLRKYIDSAYDIFIHQLRLQIGAIYQSNICNLSLNEFKTFARELFFPIEIYKSFKVIFIEPQGELD